MARIPVPIALTKIDRWLIGLGLVAAAGAAFILWLSQAIVAPPRLRISESGRPMLGLALRTSKGGLRVARAVGPAREAGLRAGDRIVAIDDVRLPELTDFAAYVASKADGAVVKIEAHRGAPDADR